MGPMVRLADAAGLFICSNILQVLGYTKRHRRHRLVVEHFGHPKQEGVVFLKGDVESKSLELGLDQLEMENLSRRKIKLKIKLRLVQISTRLVLASFRLLDIVFEVGFDSDSLVAGMLVHDEKTQLALDGCNKENIFAVELLKYAKRVDIERGYGFK